MTKELPKIFVQIASYRDPECQWTVKDLFENAKHPERVNVGICWQFDKEKDKHCFVEPYPRPEQVRVVEYDYSKSDGCCWARTKAQELWKNEEYTLQIDSHMRFEEDWDETLLKMLSDCDSEKPILTTYPSHYEAPNDLYYSLNILAADKFYNGFLLKVPYQINRVRREPIKAAFMAAGFNFGLSSRFEEVPIDPYIYFFGEECALTVRLWTNGWDFFHPHKVVLYHMYERSGRRMHHQDHEVTDTDKKSFARVRNLLSLEESIDNEVTKELEKYGLGESRSFDDYQKFCGVNYKEQVISSRAKQGIFGNDNLSIDKGDISEPTMPNLQPTHSAKLPVEWEKWIFGSVIEGHTLEALTAIMSNSGFDEELSKESISRIMSLPYTSVAKKQHTKLKRREWLLNTMDWHQRNLESYSNPKKVPLPPFKEFLEKYYYQNKIGVFTGAIEHWDASKWSMQDMVDIVGYDSVVNVQSGREKDPDYETNRNAHVTDMKFGEFIDKITSTESSNDLYMTANNHPFKNPAMKKLLKGFGDIGDGYINHDNIESGTYMWLGPKGVITPLHHDLTNNFFIQVSGKKLYHLVMPMQVPHMYNNLMMYSDVKLLESDLEKYPEFKKANVIEIELNAGDCLFIPVGCWHHVVGLTENISLTITNLNVENHFPDFPVG